MIRKSTVESRLKELENRILSFEFKDGEGKTVVGNESMVLYLVGKYKQLVLDSIKDLKFDLHGVGVVIKYFIDKTSLIFEIKSSIRDKKFFSERICYSFYDYEFSKVIKCATLTIIKDIVKHKISEENVTELNREMMKINKFTEIDLTFVCDSTIISEITDRTLVIGLTVEQALSIPDLMLFDVLSSKFYRASVINELKIKQTPVQMFKYENSLLKDLRVSTRNNIGIILRSRYKDISRVSEGIGCKEEGEVFSIISKTVDRGRVHSRYVLSPINLKTYLYN